MNEEFQIMNVGKPDDTMWGLVGGGINQYNKKHGGPENHSNICFGLYTPEKVLVGGLIGKTYWDWFYIDLLFLKEEFRGKGYGHRLLTLAEEEALQRGAKHAFLDTFSFQAPDFYKQHGYRVFGELQDFPAGHTRYYLTKQL